MVTRVGRRGTRRLFIREWREKKERTQEWLADAIGSTKSTISKYERGALRLETGVMGDIAFALGISEEDLFRHPDTPSVDALLRGAHPHVVESTIAFIETMKRRTGS